MTMEWLYGPSGAEGFMRHVQPRVLDIELIDDICRVMQTMHDEDMKRQLSDEFDLTGVNGAQQTAWEAERKARAPKVELKIEIDYLRVAPEVRPVKRDEVAGLGSLERGYLTVTGAGVSVDLRRHIPPSVSVTHSHLSSLDERVRRVTELVEAQRPRRIRWKPLLRFLPYVFAAALTACTLWAMFASSPNWPIIAFFATVTLFVWAVSPAAQRWLRQRYRLWSPGHRFREASRAAVRDHLANERAVFIWSLITVPAGGFIGWVANNVFGGNG